MPHEGPDTAADSATHLDASRETSPFISIVEPARFALVAFNPALARYIREHYGSEPRPGMTPEELLPPEAAGRWREFFSRALQKGSFDATYVTAAGDRNLILRFDRLEADGAPAGVLAVATDASAGSGVLGESESRFRPLIEDSPVAIGVSHDLRIGYVNSRYAEMFRTAPAALIGVPVVDQFAPHSRAEVADLMRRMASEDGPFEYEGVGRRADGSVFAVHMAVKVLRRSPQRIAVAFLTDVSERKAVERRLHDTLEELRALKDRLEQDNIALRRQISFQQRPVAMLGGSAAIVRVLEQARSVASADAAVLITGETGTGKGLLARAIHDMSPRGGRPMVAVNCAALPAGLIESELFGREKGAFTGAWTRQKGRFEAADGSTVFLDEVADLPLDVQAKLLGVLQDGRFERLGSAETVSVDVRVIAATNHDLGAMVASGQFRADLFYRLRVFPIEMPPLRARPEDVPALVWDAVRFFSKKLDKTIDTIPLETMQRLQQYPWPGNVRELRNLIERSVILSSGRTLFVSFDSPEASSAPAVTLEDAQRRHILEILKRTEWRIGGEQGAAALLGVRRSTLNSLMKRLGISRPRA